VAAAPEAQPREAQPPEPAPPEPALEPALEAVEEDPAPAASSAEAPAAAEEALAVARMVLEQLAVDAGEALERAHAEHRLFSEFGPALMSAFESYRHLAGEGADTAAFREALRERWGVELVSLSALRA
jgi:NADPH-dependent ferric siderophore reductase